MIHRIPHSCWLATTVQQSPTPTPTTGQEFLPASASGWAQLLLGSLGTLILLVLGALVARGIWNTVHSPSLTFGSPSVSDTRDQTSNCRQYRANIENVGSVPAEDCRASLRLKGEHDGDTYQIESECAWAEGENPAVTTIVDDDTLAVNLVTQSMATDLVRFPTPEDSDMGGKIELYANEDTDGEPYQTVDGIEPTILTEMDWYERQLHITAAGESLTGRIEFEDDDPLDITLQSTD